MDFAVPATLRSQFGELQSKLAELSRDPVKNASEISDVTSQLTTIREKINNLISEEQEQVKIKAKQEGLVYSEKLGVYTTPEKEAERVKFEALKKRIDAGETITPEEKDEYTAWLKSCLEEPIIGQHWYNSKQVEHLTKQQVPVGGAELAAFIQKNAGNLPVSFAYLMTPSQSESDNHFVSMTIAKNAQGKIEIHYLDSNGDPMLPGDRAILMKQFPGAEIVYRGANFERMAEKDATPENLLRVQFDGHNCGMYSSEITQMMQKSGMNEEKIKAGLKSIEKINPYEQRKEHSAALNSGREYVQNLPVDVKQNQNISEDLKRQAQEIGSTIKPVKPSFVEKVLKTEIVNPELKGQDIASRAQSLQQRSANNPRTPLQH